MNTEQRLSRLERSAGRWRALSLAACGCLAVLVLSGAGKDVPQGQVLSVRSLKLVDEQGKECGSLECKDGHSGLMLASTDDKASVAIGTNKRGAGMIITASNGKPAFTETSSRDNGFAVHHPNGEVAFEIIPVDGAVSLKTADAQGREIWKAPATAK